MDSHSTHNPPITAILGQACYACFKGGAILRSCGQCRSVQYCSVGCQKSDWKNHKNVCNALYGLENDETFKNLVANLHTTPYLDLGRLNTDIHVAAISQIGYLQRSLKRDLTVPERDIIVLEPRCMGCGRSNRMLRVEAVNSQSSASVSLKACNLCEMAFYCSQSHWDAAQHYHARVACADGHGGLTQCQINQEIRSDVALTNKVAEVTTRFKWLPQRIKPFWESLRNTNWDNEFTIVLARTYDASFEAVKPIVRMASVVLSMPMTILWALENLNPDSRWTRKKTLSIHVLGPDGLEFANGDVFEEILHRLPEVKTLQLLFCGPEAPDYPFPDAVETCCECATRKRKRINTYSAQRYHDYARALGNRFKKPDLAVAFNSGASQEETWSWEKTMTFLIENKIPTIFTAYNREEAEGEAKILQALGATLVPALGPAKNVWGSILSKKEPVKVTGFYSENAWMAGGFC